MKYGFTKNELLELSWEKPIFAQIEITQNCNQTCIFCFKNCRADQVYQNLNQDQWKKVFLKLKNLGVQTLNFSGGESFVYPNFIDLVKWCKNSGFEIVINTNGTFDVREIQDDVKEIIFSIHGLHQLHDKMVGLHGAFDMVEKNFSAINNKKEKASINMVVVAENFGQIYDVYHYFNSKFGLYKFSAQIAIATSYGAESAQYLTLDKENFNEYLSVLKKIAPEQLTLRHGMRIYLNDEGFYQSDLIQLPICAGGKFKIIVEDDGKVYPCNFLKTEEFYCGNIVEEDEFNLWKNGKGFIRFREFILKEKTEAKCKSCIKHDKCFAGCRVWANKGGFDYECDKRCEIGNAYVGN